MNSFISNNCYSGVNPVMSSKELAQDYYQKAMAVGDPERGLSQDQFEEINSYLDHAIALDPTYPGFYIARASIIGFTSVKRMERKEADPDRRTGIDLVSQAIAINPDFTDEHFPIGMAQLIRGSLLLLNIVDAFTHGTKPSRKEFDLSKADFEFAEQHGIPKAGEMLNTLDRFEAIINNQFAE